MTANMACTFIDTAAGVTAFLDKVAGVPSAPPSLYVDLEGVNLCRIGTLSILQVYVHPQRHTYLFDVHVMGASCFAALGSDGATSLKTILESPTMIKVFFGVSNDSDALFSHYGISLAGVHDLQLMELATRSFYQNHKFVNGLAKCIERDAPISVAEMTAWKATKEKGRKRFDPDLGGSYSVFNERPLPPDMLEYCVQDVEILPRLWALYDGKMTTEWRERVEVAVADRITRSQSPTYNGKGKHMALGPASWTDQSLWDPAAVKTKRQLKKEMKDL